MIKHHNIDPHNATPAPHEDRSWNFDITNQDARVNTHYSRLNIYCKLLESLSKKQISLLLLIDFSEAFDMVEHTIRLRKLEHYGIRGLALKWMTSYLKNRSQFVSLSGENSSIKHMQYGVPQSAIRCAPRKHSRILIIHHIHK